MNILLKGLILLILGGIILMGMWYAIYENGRLKQENKMLCDTSNQLIDTLNAESKFINNYCGSEEVVLPNITYLECGE